MGTLPENPLDSVGALLNRERIVVMTKASVRLCTISYSGRCCSPLSGKADSISQMRPHQSNDWGATFLLLFLFVLLQQRAGYFADNRRRR